MGDAPTDSLGRVVDEEALAAYLSDELGPSESFEVSYHPRGHSNETVFVTWGDDELVLRRPPPGETAETAHDILREFRVIDALQDTTVPVPTTVAVCEDPAVIGAEFYLMHRVYGDVIRENEPDRFGTPAQRRLVGEELIDGLSAIHRIEYEAVGLGDYGRPDGYTARQVDRWQQQFAWAAKVTETVRSLPLVDTVGEWLEANVPASAPQTLIHGDYMFHNVMYAPGRPPELVAIFDWELSTLGDPRADLGWLFAFYWQDTDPVIASIRPEPRTYMTREGYPSRHELVERWEDQTGFRFDHERFYRTLGVYKLAAVGEMFFRRHVDGNADDPLYPEMDRIVPQILERAQRIIDGEEPL